MGTSDEQPVADTTQRRLTIEQANQMLPLVRVIAHDIACQQAVVRELQERFSRFRKRKSGCGADAMYRDEVADFERELDEQLEVLGGYVAELEKLGLSVADLDSGTIHFAGELDHRPVLFCWTPGEDEITGWHVDDAPCSDRQSLFVTTSDGGAPPELESDH